MPNRQTRDDGSNVSTREDSRSARAHPPGGSTGWLAAIGLLGVLGGLAVVKNALRKDVAFLATDSHRSQIVARPLADMTASSGDLPVLPGLENQRFDNVVRDVVAREDPTIDGWQSERFAELVDGQLDKLGRALSVVSAIRQRSERIASARFHSTGLRPTNRRVVFSDGPLTVERGDPRANSRQDDIGPERLEQILRDQAEALRPFNDIRYKFKTIRVSLDADRATTVSRVQLSSHTHAGSRQVNADWTCAWRISRNDDNPPRLVSIVASDYEKVTYQDGDGPMFADCTESVFRHVPRFHQQLLYGIDHWTDRFDGGVARPAAGHGIAIGDVNGDGLDDLYLCQPPALPNLLLVQNQDGTVHETATNAGVDWLEGTRAALLVDLDNDGDQDLAAVLGSQLVVHENNGAGMFQVRALVDIAASSFAITAIDFDDDHRLDLYVCGYTPSGEANVTDVFANPMPYHDANNGAPNVMLRNMGSWRFEDVTDEIGLNENNHRFSYAASWDDFDNDGDMDLYVANDFGRNHLYRNDEASFRDVAGQLGVEDIGPGMSTSWSDFDNDGWVDLYVSNMFSSAGNRITTQARFKSGLSDDQRNVFRRHARGNSLFRNNRGTTFQDKSIELGVTLGRWAWGSLFVDINNDGWDDLYVTNGFLTADDNNDL